VGIAADDRNNGWNERSRITEGMTGEVPMLIIFEGLLAGSWNRCLRTIKTIDNL
jgi:hypothetical protein